MFSMRIQSSTAIWALSTALASVAVASEASAPIDLSRVPDSLMEKIRVEKILSGRFDAWVDAARKLPCKLREIPHRVGSVERASAIRNILSETPLLRNFSEFQDVVLTGEGDLLADSEKDLARIAVSLGSGRIELYFSPSRFERRKISLSTNPGCFLTNARFEDADGAQTEVFSDPKYGTRVNRWSDERTPPPEVVSPCVLASQGGMSEVESFVKEGQAIVAVLDSGVNYNHRELKDKLTRTAEGTLIGADFLMNDSVPNDEYGHGTFVAGIVAEGFPAVLVLPIRTARLRYFGNELRALELARRTRAFDHVEAQINEDQYESVRFAREHGARVINFSGGYHYPYEVSQTLATEVGPATGIVKAVRDFDDVLFVAAVNNLSEDRDRVGFAPATLGAPNVISVAAVDARGRLADFSDYGKTKVDVAALGVGVNSLRLTQSRKRDDGASFAAPQVSRTAGRMLAANPSLTPAQVREIVCSTARRSPEILRYVRCGILDEEAAVREAMARKSR